MFDSNDPFTSRASVPALGFGFGRSTRPALRGDMHFFDEIKTYIGFTELDEARLQKLGPQLQHNFSSVVEKFYEALMKHDRTRLIFDGPEQIERLRKSLMVWIEDCFSGPFDETYFLRRKKIGETHVRVGLLPHFMFGAMDIVRCNLIAAVMDNVADYTKEDLTSIEKILDIELTIMVQTYWDTLMRDRLQVPATMAAGLAHEIRNPLNTLGLHLTLLERRLRKEGMDSEKVSTTIDGMRRELLRLRGLTSEIVDFTRPVNLKQTWVDARELLSDLHQAHAPMLEASNIRFATHFEGDPLLWCDRERIYQVLVNLLSNSAEAIELGGEIVIEVHSDKIGSTITVRDDGPGMAPGLKYRVFDLFFTTKSSGTGLGLPIVQQIVVGHGGTIDIVSKQQSGTLVVFNLPRPQTPPETNDTHSSATS